MIEILSKVRDIFLERKGETLTTKRVGRLAGISVKQAKWAVHTLERYGLQKTMRTPLSANKRVVWSM